VTVSFIPSLQRAKKKGRVVRHPAASSVQPRRYSSSIDSRKGSPWPARRLAAAFAGVA